MKTTSKNRIAALLFPVIAAAVILAAFSLMSMAGGSACAYAEDKEEYTYTVSIYSGKEGYFGTEGTTVKKFTGLKYGDTFTVDASELDLKVRKPDRYYVRGLRLSGHDNDEISGAYYQTYTFEVKEDLAFSAAYGIKGGMVRYTVDYVDNNGKTLRSSDTYYGMPGDKPVVAFRHIKNYVPYAHNAMKTLMENEEDNHFVFRYRSNVIKKKGASAGSSKESTGTGSSKENAGTGSAGGRSTAGAAAGRILNAWNSADGAAGETSEESENIGDVADLDDDKASDPADDKSGDGAGGAGDGSGSGKGPNAGMVAGGAGAAVLAILLFLIFRKK